MSDNDIIQLLQKEIINDFNREAVSELLSKLLVGEIEEAKVQIDVLKVFEIIKEKRGFDDEMNG